MPPILESMPCIYPGRIILHSLYLIPVSYTHLQLYGQASSGSIEEQQLGWLGESTNIYVMKEAENITVAYLHAVDDTPLAQMDEADFMDYIDPFAFLGDPALLGYNIDDLITDSGYIEGVDYQVFSVSGQTVYTFLTGLHYMGADSNETYIEMYTQENSDIIEYFTYGFVYPESAVSTLVEDVYKRQGSSLLLRQWQKRWVS